MLQPKALPPAFRQMVQKQNMYGTGVSDMTENAILPHWHEPLSLVLIFFLGERFFGVGIVCVDYRRWRLARHRFWSSTP